MKARPLSGLLRALDPKYPTNLAIILVGFLVGGVALVFRLVGGDAFLDSVTGAVATAVGVGLAWALGRELDPDHDLSAFVAAGLASISLLFVPRPDLLTLVWVMLLLRLVNRTTGVTATVVDRLSILALTGWLAWQGMWVYAATTAVAFVVDGLLSRAVRPQLPFAALAAALAVGLGAARGTPWGTANLPQWGWLVTLATSALFGLVVQQTQRLSAVGDASGTPLEPERVRAAQALALVAAWAITVWDGESTLVALFPLWLAMLGAGLHRLVMIALGRGERPTRDA